MKTTTLLLMVAMFSVGLYAQERTVVQLSLKEAVDSAMTFSKQLEASKMDVDLYKQKVRETRAPNLPQVNAGLAYTSYFGQEMDMAGAKMKMDDVLDFTASVSYTLSFQQLASVKLTKIAQSIADENIENDVLSVKANVIDTYYTVLVYKRNMEILEQDLEVLNELKEHTEKMYQYGVSEETDVDQILINVAQVKNSLITMERNYEVAKRLLVLQMGLELETTDVNPTTNMEDLLVGSMIAVLDSSMFDITQNIDYKTMELSLETNEATLKMYRRSYIPTLSVGYTYTLPIVEGGFMNFDHTLNASINIPIFVGLQRNSQVKQAKIEIARGDTNMALLKDNLSQQEEQYRYELNSAVESYLLQKENLDVARRVLENYRNKYEQGALSSLDFTNANANYLDAETSYASACLQLLTADTQLKKLCNSIEY